jgi:hypothetical protein
VRGGYNRAIKAEKYAGRANGLRPTIILCNMYDSMLSGCVHRSATVSFLEVFEKTLHQRPYTFADQPVTIIFRSQQLGHSGVVIVHSLFSEKPLLVIISLSRSDRTDKPVETSHLGWCQFARTAAKRCEGGLLGGEKDGDTCARTTRTACAPNAY